MFWGALLKPCVNEEELPPYPLHLTHAALGVGGDGEGSSLRNVVSCRVEGGPTFVVGSLRAGSCEDLALDLVFEAGKRVTFVSSGPGDVHLTGYYVSHFVEREEGDEEEEDEEEEEEERKERRRRVIMREPEKKRMKYNDPLDLGEMIESDEEEEEEEEEGDDDDKKKDEEKEEEEEEEDDDDIDDSTPMKPKSLLAALIAEDTIDDDEADETFVLGDTTEEDAADAADQLEMEKELKIKHCDYSKAPEDKHTNKKEQQQEEEEEEEKEEEEKEEEEEEEEDDDSSKKKVHFSFDSSEDKEDEKVSNENEEHKKKVALLDARQATPYVRKERLAQFPKESTSSSNKNATESKKPDSEKKSNTEKNNKKNSFVPKGRETKEGLYIEDLVVGKGKTPKPGRPVLVKYRGTLDSGKVFDRSGKKPFRFVFGTGQVIRGWDLGLADMHVGGKRKLRIPPALAYGKERAGSIPPNSTLTFEVELVDAK